MTAAMEYRDVGGSLKDVDATNHEVLVFFPHDVDDTYKTAFTQDCFRESFEQKKPVMVWQHDLRDPIGTSTMAQVLPRGNEVRAKFSNLDKVPSADRAFSQLEDGTLSDFSFGFSQAQYKPHPHRRGIRAVVRAFMREISPVTIGSIPGAGMTSLREDGTMEGDLLTVPTLDEILRLQERKVLSEEGARALIAEHYPTLREHITLRATPSADDPDDDDDNDAGGGGNNDTDEDEAEDEEVTADSVRNALTKSHPKLAEALMTRELIVADAGTFDRLMAGQRSDDDNVGQLATAIDAALDAAGDAFPAADSDELAALPADVQQGIDLVRAAGVAADSLLDVMGIVDDDGEGEGDEERGDTVDCPTCKGTGKIGERGVECAVCKGTGKLPAPDTRADDMVECPTCDGEGKLPAPKEGGHQLTCPDCKGKGKVSADRVEDGKVRADQGDADMDEAGVTCPTCMGEGTVPDDVNAETVDARKECPTCGGTGQITPAQAEEMGIKSKTDETADDDIRGVWSTAMQNDLPDSSFAYIEPGGEKDDDGKTTPRSLRHFPIKDADGKPDAAHVRNALSRAPQSPFGDKAMPAIKDAAKELGIGDDEQRAIIALAKRSPAPAQEPVSANDAEAHAKALLAKRARRR